MVRSTLLLFLLQHLAVGSPSRLEYRRRRGRVLLETIATTACDVRTGEYSARLDVFFFYKVEYESAELDLVGIERAIATSLASSLSDCDDNMKPIYAIELNTPSHEAAGSATDFCDSAAVRGLQCTVVRGTSSILFDESSGELDAAVYSTIEETLKNTTFLHQFSSTRIVEAAFIFASGKNLVILADDETTSGSSAGTFSRGMIILSVSAAILSVMLTTAIFLWGLFRNLKREESLADRQSFSFWKERRRYFEEMEDNPSISREWTTSNAKQTTLKSLSTTWSVSDLTSDTQSIKESLPMERIDEECGLEANDDEMATSEYPDIVEKASLYSMNMNHIFFLNNWTNPTTGSEMGSNAGNCEDETIEKLPHKHTSKFADSLILPTHDSYTNPIDNREIFSDNRIQQFNAASDKIIPEGGSALNNDSLEETDPGDESIWIYDWKEELAIFSELPSEI